MTTKEYSIDLGGIDVVTFPSTSNSTLTWGITDNMNSSYSDDGFTVNLDNLDSLSDSITVSSDWNWGHNKGIQVDEDADITLGNKSLKEFMNNVEERLAILKPNPELEDRWEELKELRNKYVELEKELINKELMWEKLKK